MAENDTTPAQLRARQALSELFWEALAPAGGVATMESFEGEALRIGHAAIAAAMADALERLDARLCSSLPEGARVHDRRGRSLATMAGDLSFAWTRVRLADGSTAVPLAEALDLPHGCRVSPAASSYLVAAGAEVSYARAAALLAMSRGSEVSAVTVMHALRCAGELCAEEDEAAARDLYERGVLPGGEEACGELCLEADGTWFSVQAPGDGPRRLEVKAVVAYAGKEARGGRVRRVGCARHAMVGPAGEFMPQAVAAVGRRYDLSKVRRVHVGADGEGWCLAAGEWLPGAEAVPHLDPFHVNRAVLSCFPDPRMGWAVLDCLWDAGQREAAALIDAAAELGEARPERAARVSAYLRGNMPFLGVPGPSLGTMESENQHLYGVRMDSFPCAWSVRGASDMARLRSRLHSGVAVPRMTRERSETRRRRAARERRELRALESQGLPAAKVVQSVGEGWEPPHRASVAGLSAEVRYAAGVDKGMVALG